MTDEKLEITDKKFEIAEMNIIKRIVLFKEEE